MAQTKVKKDKLLELCKGYRDSLPEEIREQETRNCIISLKELRGLLSYIDSCNIELSKKIDGIRVYFTRSKHFGMRLKTGYNQISIAIVPTHNYQEHYDNFGAGADDFFSGSYNDEIMCLSPGSKTSEHTGLCPVNCGGSL